VADQNVETVTAHLRTHNPRSVQTILTDVFLSLMLLRVLLILRRVFIRHLGLLHSISDSTWHKIMPSQRKCNILNNAHPQSAALTSAGAGIDFKGFSTRARVQLERHRSFSGRDELFLAATGRCNVWGNQPGYSRARW